jgi:hypothetical protein
VISFLIGAGGVTVHTAFVICPRRSVDDVRSRVRRPAGADTKQRRLAATLAVRRRTDRCGFGNGDADTYETYVSVFDGGPNPPSLDVMSIADPSDIFTALAQIPNSPARWEVGTSPKFIARIGPFFGSPKSHRTAA